jgi:glutamate/aspartate transport system substrate-binding protein
MVMRKYDLERNLNMQFLHSKDHADAFMMVENDRAVAFAMDDILLFGLKAESRNPDALQVVGDALQVEPYACMLRKDDPEFKKLVDASITRLMASGEFSKLYSKWFESPIPPKGINLKLPMNQQLKDNLKMLSDKPAV